VLLVAFNLRPALTAVGPILHVIETGTGLGPSALAWLTMVPVLAIGVASVAGRPATRGLGPDRGVLVAVLMVAAGLAMQAASRIETLYLGAALSAAGIGLAGVLMPGIIKRDFPTRTGTVTGLYTMMLCLGAAGGAALSVPLATRFEGAWGVALAAWAVPALAAAAAWAPLALSAGTTSARPPAGTAGANPWRDPLGWQVTGFMGLQSSMAYIMFAWAPTLLQDRGLDPAAAGAAASLMSLGQAPAALLVPILAGRLRRQRLLACALLAATAAAYVATFHGPPALIVPGMLALGAALGGLFGLGLTLIVLRARDAGGAAALSGMVQGGGYSLAALGPFTFGLVRLESLGDGWRGLPTLLFCGICAGAALFALGAGRDRVVGGRA